MQIILTVTVLLDYIDLFIIFIPTLPIMLALCLMFLATYYAQNYAGIIGGSLVIGKVHLHQQHSNYRPTQFMIFSKYICIYVHNCYEIYHRISYIRVLKSYFSPTLKGYKNYTNSLCAYYSQRVKQFAFHDHEASFSNISDIQECIGCRTYLAWTKNTNHH